MCGIVGQPIYNEVRSVAVVLNGEIYNYRELRAELRQRRHTLTTNGDTELIALLSEEHGIDCVRMPHGTFAFALWDTRRQRLLLARDRVGKKPLLSCECDRGLSFASQTAALLGDDEIPREVDLEASSPFLDHELMEFAASIPASLEVRGSEKKWILREALRGWLPDEILDRPKQGFSVPLSGWLRGDLRAWSREVLLDRETLDRGYLRRDVIAGLLDRHAAGRDDDDKRIWALLMLELWHREFIDTGVGQRPALAVAA